MKSGLRCLKSLNGPVHLQDLLVQRREALGDAAPAQLCCVWCWVLLGRVQDEGQHCRGLSSPLKGQTL